MSHQPPYSGGRPPPAHGMQQGWSFTGPPPGHGFPTPAGPHFLQMPAAGPGFQMPQLQGAAHMPAGPMFHHAHAGLAQYGAQQFIPRPPQMPPHAPLAPRPRPPAQIYANKKEREKAKRERKEARKLAAIPVAALTGDPQPREFLNDTERQETLEWIAERKAHFPSKENLAKKRGSERRSRCDDRLFAVLQEQHKRGLLRTAGTEDLFRTASRCGSRGPPGRGHPIRPAAPCNPPATPPGDAAAPPHDASNGHAQPAEPDAQVNCGPAAGTEQSVPEGVQEESTVQAAPAAGGRVDVLVEDGSVAASATTTLASKAAHQGVGSKRGPLGEARSGQKPAKRHNGQGGGWAPVGVRPSQRQPCLLHRLVASDVRQDRNLLLQVIRFFVTNNYLQGVDVDSLQFPEGASKQR